MHESQQPMSEQIRLQLLEESLASAESLRQSEETHKAAQQALGENLVEQKRLADLARTGAKELALLLNSHGIIPDQTAIITGQTRVITEHVHRTFMGIKSKNTYPKERTVRERIGLWVVRESPVIETTSSYGGEIQHDRKIGAVGIGLTENGDLVKYSSRPSYDYRVGDQMSVEHLQATDDELIELDFNKNLYPKNMDKYRDYDYASKFVALGSSLLKDIL